MTNDEWAEVITMLEVGVHPLPPPNAAERPVRLIAPGPGDGMSEPVPAEVRTVA